MTNAFSPLEYFEAAFERELDHRCISTHQPAGDPACFFPPHARHGGSGIGYLQRRRVLRLVYRHNRDSRMRVTICGKFYLPALCPRVARCPRWKLRGVQRLPTAPASNDYWTGLV